ncbi:MAG: DNA translocase FtsK 4TM domain-containing protein, partial [Ignavibacteriales bacterium]|nr:DNA translocase FtsK 4TM domain-containing protein [Ignavibacteriales bacterium]
AKLSVIDIVRLPFNDTVKSLASALHNHLGLVGALISNFFVNTALGYGSLVVPVLMVLWGWVLLRRRAIDKPITFTNYAIIGALLFSTTIGLANLIVGGIEKEWFGIVGAFLADMSTRLLGKAGASIAMLTAFFITVILAIDLDIHKTLDRVELIWERIRLQLSSTKEADVYQPNVVNDEVEASEIMINRAKEESIPVPTRKLVSEKIFDESEEEVDQFLEGEPENGLQIQIAKRTEQEKSEPNEVAQAVESEEAEIDYVFPSVELLDPARQIDTLPEDELKANAELVRSKLANFGVEIESVSVTPGPVVTLYELVPATGVKISRITSLADDLALALAAKGIRIMAPIPGKSAVGVEIPNRNPSTVHLRSVLNSTKFRESKANLPVALGKTIAGDIFTDDLSKMPHLLIAGATGSGKSVGINTLLASLLFRLHPSDVKFVIIDPKKIELTLYGKLKHHFLAISPDINQEIITSPENAVSALKSVEIEMEKRYDRLAAAGVRNIQDYNERFKAGRLKHTEAIVHRKMPYLIVVIDELADLMITAAREVEEPIARLAQLARAVGVHLVLATQRPSVDVITGVIKANFPARIAYQVASKTDSRTILDMNGAEQLLGNGDMLYLPSGSPKPVRIQSAFISTEEVERLTDHIEKQQGYAKPFQLPSMIEKKRSGMGGMSDDRDEFFEEAARLIVRHQQGSVSLLQRRLKVGYSRAARLVDELEAAGIVGPFDGSKARLVLVEDDEQLDRVLQSLQ